MSVFLHTELAYSIWRSGDDRAYAITTFLNQELIAPVFTTKGISLEGGGPIPRICPFDIAFFFVTVSGLIAEAYSLEIESGITIVERPLSLARCDTIPFHGYEDSFFVISGLADRYEARLEREVTDSGQHAFDLSFALQIAAKALTEENVSLIVKNGGMWEEHQRRAQDYTDLSNFG